MNIELEKTFQFPCVLVGAETGPWVNSYEVRLEIRVATDQSHEYNIAYQRMKFWFQEIMHSAILIQKDHPKLPIWRDTGLACLEFPENPVDQVVGLMLMKKLTVIVEGRLEIMRLAIASAADDFISYFCDQEDYLHWFEEPGWWGESGPNHFTQNKKSRSQGKVISINRVSDWKDHDLDWGAADNIGNISMLPGRHPDATE
jgi:hypothetical protein